MAKCCTIKTSELTEQVVIQARDALPDSIGGSKDNWGDYLEAWAKVEDVSGSEAVRNGRLQSDVTHKITMRYDSMVSKHNQRLILNGDYDNPLRIEYVKELNPRRTWLELHCKSGVTT